MKHDKKQKKRHPIRNAILLLFALVILGSTTTNEEPSSTTSPASTVTATATATPTDAPTATPTEATTTAPTSTQTATPTATHTEAPTATPAAKPIPTPAYTPVPRLTDSQDLIFTMFSNDTVGATKHIVVGGQYEPSGKYEVVCMEGHGALTVNDRGFCFAADAYLGKETGSKTYELSAILTLNANDKLSLRNFNSSNLTLYFYYIEE